MSVYKIVLKMSVLSMYMSVLLFAAVLAISGHVSNGQGQACLSGFPSPTNVTSHSCQSSCTEGIINAQQLRIFPTMMITCNGVIQGLTVAGEFVRKTRPFPELQIWRPGPDGSMTYTKTTQAFVFPHGCTSLSSNVQCCILNTSLYVEVGDIVGILLPRKHKNQAGFWIYFTETSTPNYVLGSVSTSFTVPSTQPDYVVQPLIYFYIMPDPVPTESDLTGTATTCSMMNTESSTVYATQPTQLTETMKVTEQADTTTVDATQPTQQTETEEVTELADTTTVDATQSTQQTETEKVTELADTMTVDATQPTQQTETKKVTELADTTTVDATQTTDGLSVETEPTTSPLPTTMSITGAVGGIGSQSSGATAAGAAIGGVIALLLLALIVVLVVLYVGWNRRRRSFKVNKTVEVEINPINQLHYQNYDGIERLIMGASNFNPVSQTGIPVWENRSYDYPSEEIEVTVGVDYDDIVVDKPTVSVNTGVYEAQGDSDNCQTQVLPTSTSSYGTPLDIAQMGLSMPGGGHYEWGLVVPSQETRTKALSLKSQTTETGEGIYAAIGMCQYESGEPVPNFFEECETYWAPSSNANELYQQLSTKKYREILRPQIQLTDFLGAGAFGTVNKGLWQSPAGAMRVAIKTIQNKDEAEKVKFLQEAAIMGQFRHPNVVKLIGVVTVGEPVMIVLELLAGDLHSFLNKHRPAPGEMVPLGTPQLLLKFCQHISCGMEYLARKAFVHRDLAARNILVAEDKTCKISDFGMSRDLMDENYYVSHGGKVPVKWTAPEAIHYKKYSTASDVWSYGCVMYEIWSLGHKPFEGYTNLQTIRKVDKGHRLPPPPGCPREIYKFMIECWHPDRSMRLSFAQLVEILSQPEFELLYWQDEDTHGHPQALVVGAPLEAGENLYLYLQQAYLPASNNQ